jgi:DNA-binding NtrC family response regulator
MAEPQQRQALAAHSLDKLEQRVISHPLEHADGRRNRAEMLGISRRALILTLRLYGVNPSRPLISSGIGVY